MKTNELIQKTLEYNKANFEKIYGAITALQEQTEGYAEKAIEGAEFIPAEGKKAAAQWLVLARESREGIRKVIRQNQEHLERFIPRA